MRLNEILKASKTGARGRVHFRVMPIHWHVNLVFAAAYHSKPKCTGQNSIIKQDEASDIPGFHAERSIELVCYNLLPVTLSVIRAPQYY